MYASQTPSGDTAPIGSRKPTGPAWCAVVTYCSFGGAAKPRYHAPAVASATSKRRIFSLVMLSPSCWSSAMLYLLLPQCHYGRDLHCASRWEIAGGGRNSGKKQRHGRESKRVGGSHAVQ